MKQHPDSHRASDASHAAWLYAPVLCNDALRCIQPNEEAFLFTLDNAPYLLYETPIGMQQKDAEAAFTYPISPDALFILTSYTCLHSPVARWMSKALAIHYRLGASLRMRIYTALHEAIANAVIHGNLNIHGHYCDMHGFETYYRDMYKRINYAQYGSSRVAIAMVRYEGGLSLYVSDEGTGYSKNEKHTPAASHGFPVERGLAVIRQQCSATAVWQGGTTIQMDFVTE